jgi:hypothetical protein
LDTEIKKNEIDEHTIIDNKLTQSPESQSQYHLMNDDTMVEEFHNNGEDQIEGENTKPELELDHEMLDKLENNIIEISQNLTIEMIQFLSSELTHLVMIKRNEWNRNTIIEDALKIIKQFEHQYTY